MKKATAAIAALSLLSILFVIFYTSVDSSLETESVEQGVITQAPITPAPLTAVLVQQDKLDVVGENVVLENSEEGKDLVLELSLRNYFDDIIFQHLEQGKELAVLLVALSKTLGLHQPASEQLHDLFYRYQNYLTAMAEIKKALPANEGLIDISESLALLEKVYAMQYQYFNDMEIAAFFGKDRNYNQQALARLAIRQDQSLTMAQKKTLIEHQISQLEPDEYAALKPTLSANKIAKLLSNDPSQAVDVTTEISQTQIDRLNSIKAENQLWQDKVLAYKQKLAENQQQGAESYEDEMLSYQKQHFSDNELKRLQVYLKNPELMESAIQ